MNMCRPIWLAVALALGVAGLAGSSSVAANAPSDSYARLLREAALILLKEGNARFASGQPKHPNGDVGRRANTATEGQEPFATILACSDSRVPVEFIFDRGIGDLFVVRVAGNVAGTSELASVEYGVCHLNTPILLVLGHTQCGAVTAVVKGTELQGHGPKIADRIRPAVTKAKMEAPSPDETLPRAIEANVWQTITDIFLQSSEIRERVQGGKVQVIGALYDLERGSVTWLGPHPAQQTLLTAASPKKPAPGNASQTLLQDSGLPLRPVSGVGASAEPPPRPTPATAQSH